MISDIEIVNYQGHVDTSFSLGTGLNVVKGESNSGKSNIIRLLEWVFENRPRGDSFRNRDMKKKDLVSGSVSFMDENWVVREKGGSINQYLIPTSDDPLKALRTDMPTEVRDITKIHKINLQSQHPDDQYFMLTKSPGQVGKELNKIIGLTVIDEVTSTINASVRKTKSEIEFNDTELEKKEDQVKELDWVLPASKMLNTITKMDNAIIQKIEDADILENTIAEYKDILNELKEFDLLDSSLLELQKIKSLFLENNKYKKEYALLENTISTLKNIDIQLSDTLLLTKAKTALNTLKSQDNARDIKEFDTAALRTLIFKIKSNNRVLDLLEMEYKDMKKERDSYSGEQCPLCGGTIK